MSRVFARGMNLLPAVLFSAIAQVLAKPSTFVEPRRRYTNEGDMLSIHFTADERNRVYACVTDKEYPPRASYHRIVGPPSARKLIE
jgi:hypothetical protein